MAELREGLLNDEGLLQKTGVEQLDSSSLPCLDLQHLCEQLRSNLDDVFQAHCEELQRCSLHTVAQRGLNQSELDALMVSTPQTRHISALGPPYSAPPGDASRNGIAMIRIGSRNSSPQRCTTNNTRCSSAKAEPNSDIAPCLRNASPLRSTAKMHEASPLRNIPLRPDAPEPSSPVSSSTRSSASPPHMRGLLSSPRSADDSNGGVGNILESPRPPSPPGTVRTPNSFSLKNCMSLAQDVLLTPAVLENSSAAGVGLEDSPVNMKSRGHTPNTLERMAVCRALSTSPDCYIPTPSPKKASEPFSRRSLSLMTLDAAPAAQKPGKVHSPMSKRKMAVLEASQSRLQNWAKSTSYELINAAFIVFNVVFIIMETDLRAKFVASTSPSGYEDDEKDKIYFVLGSSVFGAVFVLDLLLRIHVERSQFLKSREKGWNVFDIVVVSTAVVEVVVQWYELFSGTASHFSAFLRKFSMLRIVRLLRVISHTRAVGVIRFIRELRLMVFSLTGTLKSLTWAIVLMVIILLVFGVFFTDGVVTHLVQNPSLGRNATEDLRLHFGTLSQATVSLYMAMSGGEDWGNIFRVLQPLPHEYQGAFLVFITFAILALLNVVTAVFVEAAMQVSQNDKQLVVMEEMESKVEFIAVMQQVFEELDTNDSGALSLEEFEKHIEDEKLTAFLSSFGLDVGEVRTLFTLLDVDRTGEVDLEEFVSGCLRLRGGAKSLDMAILKYQVEWILHNIQESGKKIDDLLKRGIDTVLTTPQGYSRRMP